VSDTAAADGVRFYRVVTPRQSWADGGEEQYRVWRAWAVDSAIPQ
jgi:hypothetical protein